MLNKTIGMNKNKICYFDRLFCYNLIWVREIFCNLNETTNQMYIYLQKLKQSKSSLHD